MVTKAKVIGDVKKKAPAKAAAAKTASGKSATAVKTAKSTQYR